MVESPPGRILIADDDPHTRNLLGELAEIWGHQPLFAADGAAALDLAARERPDLVLLDVRMPGPDGFEVLRRLRESKATAEVPIILLTAANEVEDKMRGIELGADDYITKPFRIVDLQKRVSAALAARRQARKPGPDEASLDPLTGVGTYPQLKETLAYEVERARRYARPLTALIVAVDDSFQIFDKLRRAAANELVSRVAEAILASFRTTDRVFRIDVEEFVILCPETPLEGAEIAARRFARSIQDQPIEAPGCPHKVTVSIGLAAFPPFGREKADDLVRAANGALERAQHLGPASVEVARE